MKTFNVSICLCFSALLSPFIVLGQENESTQDSRSELLLVGREIMFAAKTCALITVDEEGQPRVRAMDPFPPESDFTVWFGTNPKSRKVSQIENDPRVTLYYLDSDASGYVMISGIAQLVNDPKEKLKYWKDAWEEFYPDRNENYMLIKVSPISMEISSAPRGIDGDSLTWKPAEVLFEN